MRCRVYKPAEAVFCLGAWTECKHPTNYGDTTKLSLYILTEKYLLFQYMAQNDFLICFYHIGAV